MLGAEEVLRVVCLLVGFAAGLLGAALFFGDRRPEWPEWRELASGMLVPLDWTTSDVERACTAELTKPEPEEPA